MVEERDIRYFPIALFASVMGISGIIISIKYAIYLYGVNHIISTFFNFYVLESIA